MNVCFARLADIWPVAHRPRVTLGILFSDQDDVTFERRNSAPASVDIPGTTSGSVANKEVTGIRYPTPEARLLVEELLELTRPLTIASYRLIADRIPQEHRDDIRQLYEFGRMKSVLEFDPARGIAFSTKLRSDERAVWQRASKWLRKQSRAAGLRMGPPDPIDPDSSTFGDEGATSVPHNYARNMLKGNVPEGPPGLIDDKGIISTAIRSVRALLARDPARTLILERRITGDANHALTLEDVAKTLGITKARVQQLESHCKLEIYNAVLDILAADRHNMPTHAAETALIAVRQGLSAVSPNTATRLRAHFVKATNRLAELETWFNEPRRYHSRSSGLQRG